MSEELIVSASGIRGIFGRGLRLETAERYGAAYGAFLAAGLAGEGEGREGEHSGVVLLGRDSRTSGSSLADAVASGLTGASWDVGDLGIVPTPTALLAVGEDEEALGGVVVTASHNPAEWNGLKLASAGGEFISPEDGREVQARFEAEGRHGEGRLGSTGAAGGHGRRGERRPAEGAIGRHIDQILALPLLSPDEIARRGLRVALDCVRGAGGLVLPDLLERLGCEVVGIHLEPDGRFPHDPEPVAANLGELGRLVREAKADLGMAVDPDADRLALVDERGTPIGEDWTLALVVELVLARRSGPVVTNLSSSQCIADAATRAGQTTYRTRVGEANVAARMREVGAVIGGEGNGGVMLPELHATRDAPLAAALVLQLLAERRQSLGRIVAERPRYTIAKRKVDRPQTPLESVYTRLENESESVPEVDHQDGLRLSWPARGAWLHVRPSGTEPIVRVIAEARNAAEARSLADWAVELVNG